MNTLSTLAARYGIEESFRDARGLMQSTSAETRLALLAAMGVNAENDQSAEATREALEQQDWLIPVAPVHVTIKTQSCQLPITYPEGTDRVAWRLIFESGEETTGEERFENLVLVQRASFNGQTRERRNLVLECAIPLGYHRLLLAPGDSETALIVSPGKCWLPSEMEAGQRLWGVAAQLYLLKSKTNWGIGDFTDLAHLAQMLVEQGAQAIGLNPLHAMFIDAPEQASPYSPASRLLLNVLNIDITAVAEDFSCAEALAGLMGEEFNRELATCRASSLVEYAQVASLKMPALRLIFKESAANTRTVAWMNFERFRKGADIAVKRHCLFLALRTYFASQSRDWADWRQWPEEYQSPESPAVRRFAEVHDASVAFQIWLQYVTDRQLASAARAAQPMAVGLYRDLAVGADPSGAETWGNQQSVVSGAHVGAPPDLYNPTGQNWGLPPFHPMALRQECYRSFIDLVRANMRHAGGLRIDHVMGLQQLYWVPQGFSPAQGAYVRYPMEDLIGILALESHRHKCLVVGEDLGTVPEGFRERMTHARILSYRVLFFEQDGQGFIPPDRYPPLSLAVAGSHDLPTLRAWLTGSDLRLKETLGLFPNAKLRKEADRNRHYDRQDLVAAWASRIFTKVLSCGI